MRKLTNLAGLPAPIFRAIKKGWYEGDPSAFCSVSSLIKEPKEVILTMRHEDEIVEDASSKIWALLGSAVHKVLEAGEGENDLAEERLSVEILGKKITGMFDVFANGIIQDYKVTSTWTVTLNDDDFKKWTEQLNCYAYMLRQHGFNVRGLQVNAIFRDWSKSKSKREKNYPKEQVKVVPLKLWTEDEQRQFMEEKVSALLKWMDIKDDGIDVCSQEERWQDPTKYAVKKEGRKSAVRVLGSEEKAEELIAEKSFSDVKGEYFIEVRPSVPKKCESYCAVKEFCNFWKEYSNE